MSRDIGNSHFMYSVHKVGICKFASIKLKFCVPVRYCVSKLCTHLILLKYSSLNYNSQVMDSFWKPNLQLDIEV